MLFGTVLATLTNKEEVYCRIDVKCSKIGSSVARPRTKYFDVSGALVNLVHVGAVLSCCYLKHLVT